MPSPTFRKGDVVLYDNGWDHNNNGRPHVVVATCPTRGLRLCPVTSTGSEERPDAPMQPRPGGFRFPTWVAATDSRHTKLNLLWVDPSHVNRRIFRLTTKEITEVELIASAQVLRRRSRKLCVR